MKAMNVAKNVKYTANILPELTEFVQMEEGRNEKDLI